MDKYVHDVVPNLHDAVQRCNCAKRAASRAVSEPARNSSLYAMGSRRGARQPEFRAARIAGSGPRLRIYGLVVIR
jgi:hypothetical protein